MKHGLEKAGRDVCPEIRSARAGELWRSFNAIYFNDLRLTARLDAGLERLRKKCGEMVRGLQD